MPKSEPFFVSCAPGLEALLHAEMKALRLAKIERQVGGVQFEGTMADAWRANLWLRTAVRVMQRISRFQARDQDELYAGVQRVVWKRFLGVEQSFVVSAHAKESALDHTLFIEQRVKDAIADQFRASSGVRPSVAKEAPDLGVHAHIFRDRCTLLADTSGESLHKRGWRRHQGRAPLAETLAAAMVMSSGWDLRSPLLDPFCGSGTILIEAVLIAGRVPPGLFRPRFGFESRPDHDAAAWKAMVEAARAQIEMPSKLIVRGSDRDAHAVEGARENAAAAGVERVIEFEVASARDFHPRRGWNGWILTNPPYGERIGDVSELQAAYREFGARLRAECGGYHLTLLSGNPALSRSLGLDPVRSIAVKNGAIECELLDFELR